MADVTPVPGQIVVLNGAPRSGKSSIARAIQETFDGVWMNIGVDIFGPPTAYLPERYRPGIGLRPGEERHAVVPLLPALFAGLYESVAAHSRLGLNVVVDVGHHSGSGRAVLRDCARRLAGLPAFFVGVGCPIEVIMERRNAGQPGREGAYATGTAEDPVPRPVRLWQSEVHVPGIYDLEVDTSSLSPQECAEAIRRRLDGGPGLAFARLAEDG